jgi:hypothetical protein
VADLVKRHSPDLIITTGDNNYPLGQAETIDTNIGQYYASFICPYLGDYGPGGTENRFFPALGNHDWYTADAAAYLDYFTLPGNERYYDFVAGYAHLFALDSEPYEPDGRSSDSLQALWLHYYLATSLSGWQIVYMHEPPYSSGTHGSTTDMRWPFRQWGADLVLAGHDHVYERLEIDDLTYITTGMGGRSRYDFVTPIEGSLVRYNELEGALFVDVDATLLRARFYNVEDALIDEVLITRD